MLNLYGIGAEKKEKKQDNDWTLVIVAIISIEYLFLTAQFVSAF